MSPARRTSVLTGLVAVTAVALGQPTPKADSAPPVPPGVKAYVSLRVAQLWDHKAFLPAREARGRREFAWAVQSIVGVGPSDLDRVTLFWHPTVPELPFVALTGRRGLDAATVAKNLSRPGAAGSMAKGKAVPVTGGEYEFVYPVDAKTLLLVPPGADAAKLDGVVSLLSPLRVAASDHALAVGVDVHTLADLSLPFGGPLLEARTASLTVDLDRGTANLRLSIAYPTPAAARGAEPILSAKVKELAGYLGAQQKKSEARPSEANAYPAPLFELAAKSLAGATVGRTKATLTATTSVRLDEAVARLLLALPDAPLAARGPSAAENNLKLIGIAIHAYHDVHGHSPANVYGKDGTPLLSWRVQILPYLEQQALYQRFKLDEAWDSPANKQWSQTAVRTFQVPGRPADQPWDTYFRTFASPKGTRGERAWLVDGDAKGSRLTDVTDGTSNTFMVVEAGEAVPWAKPDELSYDPRAALPKLGGPTGTFAVLFGDGSTRTFRRGAFDDVSLRRCITINDGFPVNIPGR